MPNYSLVMDSTFQPFSLERYLQPLQLYGQAYKEQQDALADLETKASVWDGLANKETDSKTHKQYEDYANDLREQAAKIASQGLDINSRQAMKDLQVRYAKEITPIENAYNTRQEQIKEQRELMAKNPYAIISRAASTTSLDDYLADPSLSYDTRSGETAINTVFQEASALSKELQDEDSETSSRLKQIGGGDYYEYRKKYGYDSADVLKAVRGDADADPVLVDMVNRAVAASGIESWGNNQATQRYRDYAKQGLWGAVGTTETQVTPNWRQQAAVQHQYTMQEIAERNKPKNNPNLVPFKSDDGTVIYYDPSTKLWKDEDGYAINPPTDAPAAGKSGATNSSLTEVHTPAAMADLGYRAQGLITQGDRGKGNYEVYRDGEDITGGNSPSRFSTAYSFLDRSNAALYKPRELEGMTFDVVDYLALKEEAEKMGIDETEEEHNINQSVEGLGYSTNDILSGKIAIVKVNRRNGHEGYDYLIYAK